MAVADGGARRTSINCSTPARIMAAAGDPLRMQVSRPKERARFGPSHRQPDEATSLAMTTPTTTRTGFPAMEKAEPTFLSGHIPPWARKPLRAYMRRTVGPPVWQGDEHHCRLFQDLRLFDHWGSVERDGIRHLISQPYTPEHALRPLAEAFAQAIGCRVIACRPGAPWAPGALWVEFGPTISAFPSATATRPPS